MTDSPPTAETSPADATSEASLPDSVISEAERLTRLAQRAGDPAEATAYREQRAETLAEYEYTARIREEDDTLVLYPTEWLDGDTVVVERIEDTDRAVERPLSATAGEGSWAAINEHNTAVVERVAEEYGEIHAANATAFVEFLGNHYLRRVEETTPEMLAEFKTEYYPRNVWPDENQQAAIDDSLEYLFAVVDTDCPESVSEQ